MQDKASPSLLYHSFFSQSVLVLALFQRCGGRIIGMTPRTINRRKDNAPNVPHYPCLMLTLYANRVLFTFDFLPPTIYCYFDLMDKLTLNVN